MPVYIWNGVGLTAPDGWEPSALERDGLFLEKDGLPLCELKWRKVEGTFSFEKHLKRLAKQHRGVEMRGVPHEETPDAWQSGVTRLTESGLRLESFIWKGAGHKGIGAALHHPATGLAGLIQFFIRREEDEDAAARVLATLRDYSGGRTVPWSMFGLSARLPAEFSLDTFSFKPGHYLIRFWRPKSLKHAGKLPAGKGPGTTLAFERFAPASVLLKEQELSAFVRDRIENAPPPSLPVEEGADAVSWSGLAKSSLLRAALRRQVHASGRVWTTDPGNAILSVSATGVVPVPDEMFTTICESYELV